MRNINYFKKEEWFEMSLKSKVGLQTIKRDPGGISDGSYTKNK